MNEILAIILKDTFAQTQLKYRLRILKSNLLRTFFGTANLPVSPEDLDWLKSLPADFYQRFNKDNVYQIFSGLDSEIAKLQILTIYLTFEPDNATINQIGAFTRKIFSSLGNLPLILDIKFNPNLIAGTALSWKGIYRDYSLRQRIESRKGEISEGFKKFLR